MTRFDTPRDRSTIENLKDIYFLSNLYYYEPLSPYFDPKIRTIVLKLEDEEESCPHLSPLWALFKIPDGHFLEMVFEWKEKIDQIEAHGQISKELRESLDSLILLDAELVDPYRTWKYELPETTVWSYRISGFLKGEARGLSEVQHQALLEFIQDCRNEYVEDLDKYYVPSVEL